jgi:hypothetical protein
VATKLALYQTQTIMPLATRDRGTHVENIYAECDTIVMTVFVAAIEDGAAVKVDISESIVGAEEGEAYSLGGTGAITEVGSKRYSVRGFLCQPVFKITVTGGTVRYGIVISGKQNIPGTPNNSVDFSKIFTDVNGLTVLVDDNGNVISS